MEESPPTTEELLVVETQREQVERERAEQATTEAEQRAAERRADKAGYLREKLHEQAASES